jgi:hypothetical protein
VDKILSGFENLTGLERTSTLSTRHRILYSILKRLSSLAEAFFVSKLELGIA